MFDLTTTPSSGDASGPTTGTRCAAEPAALAGEVIRPGEGDVVLAFRPRPLSPERELVEFPAGLTLAEMVAAVEARVASPFWARDHLVLTLGGEPVPPELWPRIRPKPGTRWQLALVPGGGGFLRIALIAAVMVAATVATGGVAGLVGGGVLGGVLGAAAGAAVSIVGTLAINALIPPPQADAAKGRQGTTYSLSGSSNSPNLWGPVPRMLGKMRVVPPSACETVVELQGNTEKYLRMVVCWGVGPLQVDDIRIGDTPLDDFDEVEHEFEQGQPGIMPALSLYPTVQHMAGFSIALTKDIGWVTRTTPLDVDEATIEVGFPSGLVGYGKKTGDRFHEVVFFNVEYSLSDQNSWQAAPGSTPWTVDEKDERALAKAFRIVFPARGQYDIRVKRNTDDPAPDDQLTRNQSYWTALKASTNDPPIRQAGLCLSAFRVKATAQLSGQIANLSGIVTTLAADYVAATGTWTTGSPTQSPAALVRLWCEGNGTRVKKAYDLANLQDFHDWCRTQGFKFNFYVDSDRPWGEVLRMICAAGRAAPTYGNGKWGVIIDRPRASVGLYTPRNVTEFRGKRTFARIPHGLRIPFKNEAQNWADDERLVFMDGYDETNATKYERFEVPGVTDPALLYRFGRYHLAAAVLQPESYQIGVDWEGVAHQKGDRVGLAHDVMAVAVGSGRVKAVEQSGANLGAVVTDETFATVPGTAYALRVRRADYSQDVFAVTPAGALSNRLVPTSPVAFARAPAVGDLVALGELGREVLDCVITEVRPARDLAAQMTLIPYNEAIFTSDTAPIPDWDPRVTYPPGYRFPSIVSVRSDEIVLQRDADGSVHLQIVVSLYDAGDRPLTDITHVEVQWRPTASNGPWRFVSAPNDADEIVLPSVEADVEYAIMARYRLLSGRAGQWSPVVRHTVEGADIPPPDVSVIYLSGDRVAWSYPVPPDFAGWRVKYGNAAGVAWGQAQDVSDGLYTTAYVLTDELPDDAVELLVKGETTAGVQSVGVGRIAVSGLERPRTRAVFTDDLATRNFGVSPTGATVTGSWTDAAGAVGVWRDASGIVGAWTTGGETGLIGGEIVTNPDGTKYIRAVDVTEWAAPAEAPWAAPATAPWAGAQFTTFEWDFQYTCPSDLRPSDRLRFDLAGTGEVRSTFRWVNDIVSEYPDTDPVPAAEIAIPEDWVPFGDFQTGQASIRPFVPWRNGLRPVAGEVIQFRVFGIGGSVPATVASAKVVVQAAETVEAHAPVTIGVGGTVIVPDGQFRAIAYVHATIVEPSDAWKIGVQQALPGAVRLVALDLSGASVASDAHVTIAGV